MASKIIGCGGYLPEKILTNHDLEKVIDTNDEWIVSRTGIKQRHIAGDNEYASSLAYKASLRAIEDANIDKDQIDLIIAATTTPDNSFPSIATKLQGHLGIGHIPSFDLQAVCSGFIYGMQVADNMLKSGKYKTVLLVCAEKMSSLLNWEDRKTCVLFGDGAGAVILQRDNSNSGIIDSNIYSDGSLYDILYTDDEADGNIKMNGPEVFRNAVERMGSSIVSILNANGLNIAEVDFFIPHQANLRIINNIAVKLGIDPNKIITTVDRHANCSAASIPLALWELKQKVQITSGCIIACTAFGAGATWGSLIFKW